MSEQFGSQCLPNLRIDRIEQPKPPQLADIHPLQPRFYQPLGQLWQQPLPVSRAVFAVLFKLDDAVTDEPVPQGEADVNSLGGKVLSSMVNLDNCGDKRFKVAGHNGADFLLFRGHSRDPLGCV